MTRASCLSHFSNISVVRRAGRQAPHCLSCRQQPRGRAVPSRSIGSTVSKQRTKRAITRTAFHFPSSMSPNRGVSTRPMQANFGYLAPLSLGPRGRRSTESLVFQYSRSEPNFISVFFSAPPLITWAENWVREKKRAKKRTKERFDGLSPLLLIPSDLQTRAPPPRAFFRRG